MQKTKFKIQGIKCDNCPLLIEERLKQIPGIEKVKIDQTSNKGVVIYDEQKIDEQGIYKAIESINEFQIEKIEEEAEQDLGIKKAKFTIKGIKCNSCVMLIEDRLKNKPGVIKAKVDQISRKGVVVYDKQKIAESDIYKTIEEIGGFRIERLESKTENSEENDEYASPDMPNESKPPAEVSDKKGIYSALAVVALITMFLAFGPKSNQAGSVSGFTQNNAIQNQEQAGSQQQPTAGQIAAKSDNPVLEAYVVSRCPFGLQMQRILADVEKNIPSFAPNIKVRYIGSVSGGTITSMHGTAEAQENFRQICLREEQPEKYWPYVSCQMRNGDTSGCERSAGVDSAKLNTCILSSTRGLVYAQKDFELVGKYGIQGSPTLVLNGQEVSEFNFGGRTSDALKSVICSGFNKQPDACSTKLSTANAATSFSN